MNEKELRRYSRIVVDGVEQAPSRAMLRAVGFTEEDFHRPQVGIASTWSMVTPCNMHIDGLAKEAAAGSDGAREQPAPPWTRSSRRQAGKPRLQRPPPRFVPRGRP